MEQQWEEAKKILSWREMLPEAYRYLDKLDQWTGSRYAERVDVFFAAPQRFASEQ